MTEIQDDRDSRLCSRKPYTHSSLSGFTAGRLNEHGKRLATCLGKQKRFQRRFRLITSLFPPCKLWLPNESWLRHWGNHLAKGHDDLISRSPWKYIPNCVSTFGIDHRNRQKTENKLNPLIDSSSCMLLSFIFPLPLSPQAFIHDRFFRNRGQP